MVVVVVVVVWAFRLTMPCISMTVVMMMIGNHRGSLIEAGEYAVSGSGAMYVVGYLDSIYSRASSHQSLEKKDCEVLVRKALGLALERDSLSGGLVTLCRIDKDGVHKKTFTRQELMATQ